MPKFVGNPSQLHASMRTVSWTHRQPFGRARFVQRGIEVTADREIRLNTAHHLHHPKQSRN
eukprot:353171-Chlamydomonas_euryale.AAC.11